MPISYFDTTGYTKMPKEEFWKRHDSNDDYILDVFEFCEQDPDGDVWVPSTTKYWQLSLEKEEELMREADMENSIREFPDSEDFL